MADRRILDRSHSVSRNEEAGDAGSSSGNREDDAPFPDTPPVIRLAPSAPPSQLPVPSSSSGTAVAHTVPTLSGNGPLPGLSNAAAPGAFHHVRAPDFVLNAGVMTIKYVGYTVPNLETLLRENPGVHSVLVRPENLHLPNSVADLIEGLSWNATIKTLAFDFETPGPAFEQWLFLS